MKIVYFVESLFLRGGIERIISDKANYLSEHFGYDIYIVTCAQKKSQPNAYYLSKTIHQIYLEIPYYSQYRYNYPKRLIVKYSINQSLKKAIHNAVKDLNPDIIIGMGQFLGDIVSSIDCKAKKIIESHEARCFTDSDFGKHGSTLSKFFARLYRKIYFRTIEQNADLIVTLTEEDKVLWNKARRVVVIPNFSSLEVSMISNCETKRVLAVGRLGEDKGFDRLIEIWKIVSHSHPNWQLDIYGNGSMERALKDKIELEHVNNISIKNATSSISFEYAHSSIFVLTSYFEGFALVLLEAMKHGVPCIAFDCPFGPRHIIEDNKSGYLIANGDINQFAQVLSLLIDNHELREQYSKASIERAKLFDIDVIMNYWKNLFESLICQY